MFALSAFFYGISHIALAISVPAELQRLESRYKAGGGVHAFFKQTQYTKAFDRTLKSAGELWIQIPDRFRWETREPDPNTLVSNGKTLWLYTPPFDEEDRGQVVIQKSEDTQSALARALLSGRFQSTKDVVWKKRGPRRFEMIPQSTEQKQSLSRAELLLSPALDAIVGVTLYYPSGNKTELTLDQVELSASAGPESRFEFKIPSKTDVVR